VAVNLTERDMKLVRDVALSHTLSRDQVVNLGYFGTVTRANSRLRGLVRLGLLQVLATPYHGQFLYSAGRKAWEVVGERIAALLTARKASPQFVQHALAVTDARIALVSRGFNTWRFEQQVRHRFKYRSESVDLRPDGLAISGGRFLFVELDLGHTSKEKWRHRFQGYSLFLESGAFEASFGKPFFEVLIVTTGDLRKRHIDALTPATDVPLFRVVAAKELGLTFAGGWS
jgi:hypothetical protein